eukprot:g6483.t1
MKFMKVFCVFTICLAACEATFRLQESGNTHNLKLGYGNTLSLLQTYDDGKKGGKTGGKKGSKKGGKTASLQARSICKKDNGNQNFPPIPEVLPCPYEDSRLCRNAQFDKHANANKRDMKDGETYNCIIPEVYRGVKCPAGIKLPQVNTYAFKKRGSKETILNIECEKNCKRCNSGGGGFKFDGSDNETPDLRGWEILQIPTTTAYSKRNALPIPWISAHQWDSQTGTYTRY